MFWNPVGHHDLNVPLHESLPVTNFDHMSFKAAGQEFSTGPVKS